MRRCLLALLTACLVVPAAAQAGAVSLRMVARDGAGHERRATLTCDGDGFRATGYLRGRAGKACRRAYALRQWFARGVDSGRACTEIYGGPDRARIRGNIADVGVDRRFSRTDGCAIADWDVAQRLLPRPVGVRPRAS